jgi:hypothetical protein
MSRKPFDGKFSKDLHILNRTTKGESYLGDYPKLHKKLKKYFEQQNIEFCGEPETDNLYLIDLIREELQNSEKALTHS